MDSAFEIPSLTRTDEYVAPAEFLMPDPSWLVRTTADMGARKPEEPINDEAYWADVFGNNWEPEQNNAEEFQAMREAGFGGSFTEDDIQAAMDVGDAAYWAEIFGDWGQEPGPFDYEDPLAYDDDEVYDMLLLE